MITAYHRSLGSLALPITIIVALGCSGTSGTSGSLEIGGNSSTTGGNTPVAASSGGQSGVVSGSSVGGRAVAGGRESIGGSAALGGGSSTTALGGQSSAGATGTGGTRSTTPASGGASTAAGGSAGGGGSSASTGGRSTTGGIGSSGGSSGGTALTTGGRITTGGSVAAGGKSTAGSTSATGGKSTTGGTPATGGKNGTGGASAAGGNASTGGATGCDVSEPPANVAAWIEESWNAEGHNNMSWYENWLHDSAILGKGQINICVRYGATQAVSVATRDRIAPAMQRWFNKWFSKLYPYDCFPYPSVTVKVTGWAVKPGQESLLQWADRTVPVYTEVSDGSDQAKGEPKCPDSCGFFFHPDHVFTGCANGADAHFDYTLWLNDKLPSGAAAEGSNWGVRIPVASFLKDLDTDDFLVMLHEIGHGFGISDYYSWTGSTPVGGSVMMLGTADTVSIGDQWMARRYWRETKALRYP